MIGKRSVRAGKVLPDNKMTGKTILITGANAGLGLASAIDLAKRQARVIMACRNIEKGEQAKQKVVELSESSNVLLMQLDLASMKSVRDFAAEFLQKESRLDVLMNNAGVMMCPQSKTMDGFEIQFGTNHLGHFLLTSLLLDLLKRSAPSRIVTVSSIAHEKRFGGKIHWDDMNLTKKKYNPVKAYSQSKLMNVLFSRELSKRLEGTGVTTYCIHPGGVKTELNRHVGHQPDPACWDHFWTCLIGCTRPCWQSPSRGAQTQIYCTVAPELEKASGKYYADCAETRESDDGRNDEYAKRLWDISEECTRLKGDDIR